MDIYIYIYITKDSLKTSAECLSWKEQYNNYNTSIKSCLNWYLQENVFWISFKNIVPMFICFETKAILRRRT